MKRYLFIDRDGTLVYEPHDYQVDALNKIAFLPRVVPALLKLQNAGFTLVMVSNQDGLGTESFPLDTFTPSHEFIINTLESQGLNFEQILICPHKPEDNCECRKPKIGMVRAYLENDNWDRAHSFFIGDRDTDLQMAQNMGITGIRVGDDSFNPLRKNNEEEGDENISAIDSPFAHIKALSWDEIAQKILSTCGIDDCAKSEAETPKERVATVTRNTKETQITISVDLDKVGESKISTGVGFFDHMLDQIATHAGFSMDVKVKGDLEIDSHHTIEDTAIALGTAIRQALGEKRGIGRFGFVLPMDEVMCKIFGAPNTDICELSIDGPKVSGNQPAVDRTITVALDISGRPHVEFSFHGDFTREDINGFETQMVPHFFESLAVAMGLTLHMEVTKGNAHHQVEALFKAFGRALRPAIKVVGKELPSSKGTL